VDAVQFPVVVARERFRVQTGDVQDVDSAHEKPAELVVVGLLRIVRVVAEGLRMRREFAKRGPVEVFFRTHRFIFVDFMREVENLAADVNRHVPEERRGIFDEPFVEVKLAAGFGRCGDVRPHDEHRPARFIIYLGQPAGVHPPVGEVRKITAPDALSFEISPAVFSLQEGSARTVPQNSPADRCVHEGLLYRRLF